MPGSPGYGVIDLTLVENPVLKYQPAWNITSTVRKDIIKMLESCNLAEDDVDAVSMVGTELAENAVKYGVYSEGQFFSVAIECNKDRIVVTVSNPFGEPARENLERCLAIIDRIEGSMDPGELYRERILALAQGQADVVGEPGMLSAGLGLLRVGYEGQAHLEAAIVNQDQFRIRATYIRSDAKVTAD